MVRSEGGKFRRAVTACGLSGGVGENDPHVLNDDQALKGVLTSFLYASSTATCPTRPC